MLHNSKTLQDIRKVPSIKARTHMYKTCTDDDFQEALCGTLNNMATPIAAAKNILSSLFIALDGNSHICT